LETLLRKERDTNSALAQQNRDQRRTIERLEREAEAARNYKRITSMENDSLHTKIEAGIKGAMALEREFIVAYVGHEWDDSLAAEIQALNFDDPANDYREEGSTG
jgi:hypothetical protein